MKLKIRKPIRVDKNRDEQELVDLTVERETDGKRNGGDRRDARGETIHVVQQIDRVGYTDQPEDRDPDVYEFIAGDRQFWPEPDDDRCTDELTDKLLVRLDVQDIVEQTDDERERARPAMMSDSVVFGTRAAYISSVARKIATPPIIAVGRLCQRSDFGLATNPARCAYSRTT